MVKKYKSKPIIIEAIQWKSDNFNEIYEFTEGQANLLNVNGEKVLVLLTLEGSMSAEIGDFIIRGRVGEYYPCKSIPFHERYEEVEEWRDIKDYEGLYQVSNLGRVKSLKDSHGKYREKILNLKEERGGYLGVGLHKLGTQKSYFVHRLVAEAFIPNPSNYPQVNHKDENKQNNRVENLEWCTREFNLNYGTRTQRASEKLKGKKFSKEHCKNMSISHKGKNKGSNNGRARKVQCITTEKKFNTIKEAGEYYSINKSTISACCRGKRKSAGKHPVTGEELKWRYY